MFFFMALDDGMDNCQLSVLRLFRDRAQAFVAGFPSKRGHVYHD